MQEVLSYFKNLDRRSTTVLASVPILLTVYMYQGNRQFFADELASGFDCGEYLEWCSWGYQYLAAIVLFVVVPFLLIKLVLKEKLSDYGWALGDWKWGLKALAIVFPPTAVVLFFGAMDPEIQAAYPLVKACSRSVEHYLAWAGTMVVFYVAWETMFRGFMLFGLKDKFGMFGAIMVQVLASTIMHYDKPFGETFSAIFAGVMWGAIAFRSRSILYVFLFHWWVGIANDLFSLWHQSP